MSTISDEYTKLFHDYQRAHGGVPESPYKVCEWALANGYLAPPKLDPIAALADDMARALREEYATDARGRRYRRNHAVKVTRNSIQFSLWAEMATAPRQHMEKAFQQRRRQIVGDCQQLKTDVDVYNDKHPEMEQIPLVLDFTDDVAELEAFRGEKAA